MEVNKNNRFKIHPSRLTSPEWLAISGVVGNIRSAAGNVVLKRLKVKENEVEKQMLLTVVKQPVGINGL